VFFTPKEVPTMKPAVTSRRLAPAALTIALVLTVHAPPILGPRPALTAHGGVSPPVESAARSMPFDAEFSGVDTDHMTLVWRGHVGGTSAGALTLSIKPLCTPLASAEPVWPIRVRWSAEGGAGRPVSVAELEGIVDWKSHRMHVDGMVVEGTAKGRQVTLHAVFRSLDPVGTLSLVSQHVLAGDGPQVGAASAASAATVVPAPAPRRPDGRRIPAAVTPYRMAMGLV
jgi:hypothetical protein